jgi:predicted DNA-binding transcriptional regulator AlpA
MPDKWFRLRQVLEVVPIGKTHLLELEGKGLFPRSFTIKGSRVVFWSCNEIQQWMEQQKEQHQPEQTVSQ